MGKFNRWRSTIYTVVWIASVILALPTAASAQRIEEGMAVEVDGTWTGEYIAIKKLVREIPDDLPEIKGHPTKIDQFRSTLTIPPFVIEIDNDTDIDDADDEGDSYVLGEFELEWHYEIEVEAGHRQSALDRLELLQGAVHQEHPRRREEAGDRHPREAVARPQVQAARRAGIRQSRTSITRPSTAPRTVTVLVR